MSTLSALILIFFGGGLGSISRFGVGKLALHFYDGRFPLGTLITNTIACTVLGLTLFLFKDKLTSTEWIKYFVIIGFCGGFSTFSAFGLETVALIRDGLISIAVLNILVSLALGFSTLYFLYR